MKLRIVATALLIMVLSVSAVSEASARPWGYRGGWYGPRIGVRVGMPAPVIVADGYGGGYCAPAYYGGGYAYGPAYYGHPYYGGGPRYYGGGYAHGGGYRGDYGRGYARGGYAHGGGYGHGGGYRGRR